MSLVEELKQAHRERQARMAAAARRHLEMAASKAPLAPEPPKRRVAIPPGLIRILTEPEVKRLPMVPESADAIIAAVCKVHGITRQELLPGVRATRFGKPRQLAIWVLLAAVEESTLSWVSEMVKRHHTSVLHGWKTVESEFKSHRDALSQIGIELGLPLTSMSRQRAGARTQPSHFGAGNRPHGFGKRKPKRRPRSPVVIAPPRASGSETSPA